MKTELFTEKENNDIKKEYLNGYKFQCKKIKALEEQLESLRASIESAKRYQITDMPGSKNQTDISDSIVKLEKVVTKIMEAKKERIDKRADIESVIVDMEDGTEAQIIHKRYIELKDWEEICYEIGYSWKQTHRYHNSALKNFKMS